MQDRQITICACVSRSFISKDKVATIAVALRNEAFHVTIVPDLCSKVMQKSPDMQEISSGIIMACHPRAIRSHLNGLDLTVNQIVDIRDGDCAEVFALFGLPAPDSEDKGHSAKIDLLKEIEEFPVENGRDAWYPVLDKERCIECGRCHDFCLFGVYTVENKQVKVVQPQHCKNNCPACARICPSKAIIFPKYEKSPINGGTTEDEISNPEEMDKIYNERLRMRLQQRRAGVSLFKKGEE